MSFNTKTRTKGTDLKGVAFENTDLKTLKRTYVADRSSKRLVYNMKWIVEFIRATTPNLNTRSARVYDMKKHFMTLYPSERYDLIGKHLVLSTGEYQEKAATSSVNRSVALEQVFTITPEYTSQLLTKLRDGSSLEHKILLLQLSTGRRVADILYAADIPSKKGSSIIFTRLSKSDSKAERKVPLYFIPYSTMKSTWEDVREEVKHVKDFAYAREKVIKLAKSLTNFGSHFMRKMYVAHSLQFKPKRWNDTVWINRILAHKKGCLDTALNYSNIKMGDDVELTKSPKAVKKTAAYARLLDVVSQMNTNGEPLTHVYIKARGFGSSTIQRHLKSVIEELGL